MVWRIFTTLFIFLTPVFVFAATDSNGVNVQMFIMGCNNDTICEPLSGEDATSCPLDCTVVTPPPPPPSNFEPPTTSYSGGGYMSSAQYVSFEITPGDTYAVFTWVTDNNTLNTFSWGETPDYEFGSMSEVTYHKNHTVKIQGLKSGVDYYYKITTRDASGATIIKEGSYRLPVSDDYTPPANPPRFNAEQKDNEVLLKWDNPQDPDFKNVQIVRSPYGYPKSPLEGKIVYEGNGNYVFDPTADPGTTYYYTIFSYDQTGNRSSGAVSNIKITIPGSSPTATTTPSRPPLYASSTLALIDFDFSQRDRKISFLRDSVPITAQDSTTVSLSVEKIPNNTRYILLTVKDETPWNTYLFAENVSKTSIETIIAPLERVGMIPFDIVVAYEGTSSVTKIEGYFSVTSYRDLGEKSGGNMWDRIIKITAEYKGIIAILTFLLLLIILGIIRRKKRKQPVL